MKELYVKMCESSPVQKEWKPKVTDKIAWYESDGSHGDLVYGTVLVKREQEEGDIWLPRQEDFQERLGQCCSIIRLRNWCNNNIPANSKLQHELNLMNAKDYWNILWCLFVHREVYGMVWDWDSNVWRKA